MKPEKAIEDLQARIAGELCITGEDDCADMKLGIEALKFVTFLDGLPGPNVRLPLPGETEE